MKLLLIVPHPDDEVYGAGGTIMEFVRQGHQVGLVTLTRGEKGRTLGLADSPEELARMRAVELRACLDILGVQRHEQHEYPDGGLADVPMAELTRVARDAIERHAPEILLTFPPNGSNGHRDHIATSAAVRDAHATSTHKPELWFYAGQQPDDPELARTWLAPNVSHDVTPHLERKLQAIACHRTQALSTVDFIRRYPARIITETFHRAH